MNMFRKFIRTLQEESNNSSQNDHLGPCDEVLHGNHYTDEFIMFSIVWLVCLYTFVLGSLLWWFSRRNTLYLKRRNFPLILFMCLGVLSNSLSGPVSRATHTADNGILMCILGNFTYIIVVPLILGPQVIRLELYRKRYLYCSLVAEKLENVKKLGNEYAHAELMAPDQIVKLERSLHEAKYQASLARGIKLAIMNVVLSILIGSIYFMITCPVFREKSCEYSAVGDAGSIFFLLVSFLFICFHFYVQRKTKGYPDAFGILHEIKWAYFVPICVFGLGAGIAILDPGGITKRRPQPWSWGVLAGDFAILALFLYTVPYQVWKSYLRQHEDNNIGVNIALEDVLNDPLGAKLFEQHLLDEFSIENLTFWKTVNWWKEKFESTPRDVRKLEAKNIYSRWISDDAMLRVNVGDGEGIRIREIIESIDQVESDLFDSVHREVYRLMSFDSFSRFKQSEVYKDFYSGTGNVSTETSDYSGQFPVAASDIIIENHQADF